MQLTTLLLLTHLSSAPARLSESRPAPASGEVAASEDEELSEEAKQQSEELEELRALEEVALNPATKPSANLLQSVRRLGATNPLREQLAEGLSEPELAGEFGTLMSGPMRRAS